MQHLTNKKRGARLFDINELVELAEQKKCVIIEVNDKIMAKPASFVLHWTLAKIIRTKIFHALPADHATSCDQ